MTNRPIRVLLIDGQTEDSRWIQELLADFEEGRFGGGWMHGIELFHLERLTDAITVLEDAAEEAIFDIVLLNPALPDSAGLHSYLRLRHHAPTIPVVILTEEDDPDLAISMVRAGAQDFLAKSTLDCVPLAHSLRLAVERTRILCDLQTLTWRDESTGLYNQRGLDTLASHGLAVARRHGHLLGIVFLEVNGLTEIGQVYGREEEHLALTETADLLRSLVDAPATLARVDSTGFALSLIAREESEAALQLAAIQRRFQRVFGSKANRRLTLRAGIAWRRPGDDFTVADLLLRARRELSPLASAQPLAKSASASQIHGGSPVPLGPAPLASTLPSTGLEAVGFLCENGGGENRHADATAFRSRRNLQS
ncbi:MAG: diguanylate cyclase, partial [Bryobacterales bacterium]|nr:diguanylate cyclase [Bryobacterales bacterium]